ncbi:MAG: glycosyltransferase family 2 protein [Lacisediminihabitans sp.]
MITAISVVIPSWNDAELLAVCLEALARQTRPADEIIVVDNGSTDNTAAVGEAAGARVVSERLRGIFPATAAGFDAASGDIIARLDADSIPPEDWLERIETILSTSGELSAVTGPGDFYGANRVVAWLGRVVYMGGYFWAITPLLGHPPLFGSNCALHAAIWSRIRGSVHRELREIHDDVDLSYHLEPDMTVIYEPTLRVGISARPFESWSSLGRRLAWSYRTFSLNFREQPPWRRLRERKRWAREHSAEGTGPPQA